MPSVLKPSERTVLTIPPVKWDAKANRMGLRNLDDLQRSLCGLCVHIARAHGYFNARSLGRDHETAVRESNRTVARVRKALGYTYPKDDITF